MPAECQPNARSRDTAMDSDGPAGQMPSPTLVESVTAALEHLYDLAYLQQHPLVLEGPSSPDGTPSGHGAPTLAGQRLRQELVAAVEMLNPGPGVAFQSPQARAYNLLRLHYVEGLTVREAGQELGLSLRQSHRDLAHARENVATALFARWSARAEQEVGALQLTSFQAEMARLESWTRPTDVRMLLQRALDAVGQQAKLHRVELIVHLPDEPVVIPTDPTVAEQVLVTVLSQSIGQAGPGSVLVSVVPTQPRVGLRIQFDPASQSAGRAARPARCAAHRPPGVAGAARAAPEWVGGDHPGDGWPGPHGAGH